jgi:prepilin-type processing-associated H-X9-DG protein
LWFTPLNIQRDYVLWSIEQDIILERHATTSHYLFLDAHVEPIAGQQIRQWAEEGHNFAKPQ